MKAHMKKGEFEGAKTPQKISPPLSSASVRGEAWGSVKQQIFGTLK
jgi:hypothetical protein